MPKQGAQSVSKKSVELAAAVPQVMAHRLTRMALSGPTPSARDQKEFALMVQEKQLAFTQAWWAMFFESVHNVQTLTWSCMSGVWNPFAPSGQSVADIYQKIQSSTLDVVNKGLTPVHRTAVANAKRLSRTRLR